MSLFKGFPKLTYSISDGGLGEEGGTYGGGSSDLTYSGSPRGSGNYSFLDTLAMNPEMSGVGAGAGIDVTEAFGGDLAAVSKALSQHKIGQKLAQYAITSRKPAVWAQNMLKSVVQVVSKAPNSIGAISRLVDKGMDSRYAEIADRTMAGIMQGKTVNQAYDQAFDSLNSEASLTNRADAGIFSDPDAKNLIRSELGVDDGEGGDGSGDDSAGTEFSPYQAPRSVSQQFWQTYHPGRSTPGQFSRDQQRNVISNAYRQSLGRDPRPEEIDHWEAQINSGAITPDMAVQNIAGSEEARNFTGQPLGPQQGPGQMLPGAGGGGVNALRRDAPISGLIAGGTGQGTQGFAPGGGAPPGIGAPPPGGGPPPGEGLSGGGKWGPGSYGPGFTDPNWDPSQGTPGEAIPPQGGPPASQGQNPYVENYTTPGNQYGTVEDMYRANLPNMQNALRTGRGDYETGYQRSSEAYEEAYNRAIQHLETGYQRGRTDVTNMLNETRQILAPYGEAGEAALGRLDQAMGGDFSSFRQSPDYQFRLQEGEKALQRQASARGDVGAGGMGGRFAKELTRYGQGLASTEYGNWFNRNNALANMGLQARGIESNALTSAGGTLANLAGQTAQGQAGAANVAGAGKAQAAQFAAHGMAGLTRDIADMSTRYGIAARQADVGNALQREGLGIDWARLALAETEADRNRAWNTEMAERGYDIWRNENQRNRQTSIWNNVIGAGGWAAGRWF